MAALFYNGFDVVTVDEDGNRTPLANETLDIDIVGGGSLGTVETDAFGYVESDTFASGVAVGDRVEFSLSAYTGTIRRRIGLTLEAAEADEENITPVLIAETDAEEVEATKVMLWVRDLDNYPEVADIFLGYGTPGQVNTFTFPAFQDRNLRVWGNPATDDGRTRYLHHTESESTADLTASAAAETPATGFEFSQAAAAGNLVNIWDDGGTIKARLASSVNSSKPAHGFARSAVDEDETGIVLFSGSKISGLSGLTPGQALYLSETPGAVTHLVPDYRQRIGTALSTTTAIFEPHPMAMDPLINESDGSPLINEDTGDVLTGE